MIRVISAENRSEYKTVLAKVIIDRVKAGRLVLFVDCQNSINQYLFRREDIPIVLTHVFVVRIERFYDLLDLMKCIHLNKYFRKSRTLILPSYNHLLEEIPGSDRDEMNSKITEILARLEMRCQKEIIFLEVKSWGTRFLRSG